MRSRHENLSSLGPAAVIAVAVAATIGAAAGPAGAAATHGHFGDGRAGRAVFVQTDNPAGNQVVAYHQGHDGRLTQTGTYSAGGLGRDPGRIRRGPPGLTGLADLRPAGWPAFRVNAGSITVSVRGDQLTLRQVTGSGGAFPVGVAVHGDLWSTC